MPSRKSKHSPWPALGLGLAIMAVAPAGAQISYPGCAEVQEADFAKTTLLSTALDAGFIEPLRVKIDASGRVYVALKRSGQVLRLDPADGYKKQVLGTLAVTPLSFHGLLGMALAPDFARTGYLFVLTTHRATPSPGPILFRISRVTVSGAVMDTASQKTVLEWPTDITEGHTGGDLEFGPDGSLYATTGNDTWARPSQIKSPKHTYPLGGGDAYRTPIDELEPEFNSLRSSANTNDLRGKVLRIKPIDVPATHPRAAWGAGISYTIPAGNLFPPGTAKTRPEVFAMGLRNPYSIHLGRDGAVYLADVGPQGGDSTLTGPSGGDQLYILRKPANLGFPMFVDGWRPYPIFDFATGKVTGWFDAKAPINFSRYNTGRDSLPPPTRAVAVSHWEQARNKPGWFSSGSMVLISGGLYRYDGSNPSAAKFPPHFDGKWIIADEQKHELKAVSLKGDSVTDVRRILAGQKFYNPVDMEFGPDGSLFVIEYSGWNSSDDKTKLSRIAYQGSCRPTVALRPRYQGVWAGPGRAPVRIAPGAARVAVPAGALGLRLLASDGRLLAARALDGKGGEFALPPEGRQGLRLAYFGFAEKEAE